MESPASFVRFCTQVEGYFQVTGHTSRGVAPRMRHRCPRNRLDPPQEIRTEQ